MDISQGRPAVDDRHAPSAPVIAVVGTCEAERREFSRRTALTHDRLLLPAEELARDAAAVERALGLAALTGRRTGLVVECPERHCLPELIGELGDPESGARLQEVVCVVDASHLLFDLTPPPHADRDTRELALRMVELIEFSSAVVLVHHEHLAAPERDRIRALLNGLNPTLRWIDPQVPLNTGTSGEPMTTAQDRAGWVRLLSGEHPGAGTHAGVTVWRYEQLRPFHPQRLQGALRRLFSDLIFGTVLRSVGFCHLASRSHVTVLWEYVGRSLSLSTLGYDQQVVAADEVLAWGQDLAFIGLDLETAGLQAELDRAVLTDAELAAGPQHWRRYPDPFPG